MRLEKVSGKSAQQRAERLEDTYVDAWKKKKRDYESTIASSRITMEKQLLRKASYLIRNYYFPAYLIVAGIPIFNVGSCKRVELVVLLERLPLHLRFLRSPCHMPVPLFTLRAVRSTSIAQVTFAKLDSRVGYII